MLSSMERPRALAKSLRRILRRSEVDVTLSASQEAVARMLGYRDWHHLTKTVGTAAPSADDRDCDPAVASERRALQTKALIGTGIAPAVAILAVESLHATDAAPRIASPRSISAILSSPSGEAVPYPPRVPEGRGVQAIMVGVPGTGKTTMMARIAEEWLSRQDGASRISLVFVDADLDASFVSRLARMSSLPSTSIGLGETGVRVNPFDTRPGLRRPTRMEFAGQCAILQTLIEHRNAIPSERTDARRARDVDRSTVDKRTEFLIRSICELAIYSAYDRLTDLNRRSVPKIYVRGLIPEIDATMGHSTRWWWNVVDELAERGDLDLAALAQRQAVPTIEDVANALESTSLRDVLAAESGRNEEVYRERLDISGELARHLRHLTQENPILKGPTNVETPDNGILLVETLSHGRSISIGANVQRLVGRHLTLRTTPLVGPLEASSFGKIREIATDAWVERHSSAVRHPTMIANDEMARVLDDERFRKLAISDVRWARETGIDTIMATQTMNGLTKDVVSNFDAAFLMAGTRWYGARYDLYSELLGANVVSAVGSMPRDKTRVGAAVVYHATGEVHEVVVPSETLTRQPTDAMAPVEEINEARWRPLPSPAASPSP